jgi:hypothetical protein
MGGPGSEIGPEVEVDGAGNSYLTGTFSGTARVGDQILTTAGLRGAFVAKVSPGGRVAWAVSSTDSGFATLGELSLGPNGVNVLGRFGGTAHFGPFRFHERRGDRLLPGSAEALACSRAARCATTTSWFFAPSRGARACRSRSCCR